MLIEKDIERLAFCIYGMLQGKEPDRETQLATSHVMDGVLYHAWNATSDAESDQFAAMYTAAFEKINRKAELTQRWSPYFNRRGIPSSYQAAFEFLRSCISAYVHHPLLQRDIIAGTLDCSQGSIMECTVSHPLSLDYYTFYWTTEGSATLSFDNTATEIGISSFLIVPPNIPCVVERRGPTWKCIWGCFKAHAEWIELINNLGAAEKPSLLLVDDQCSRYVHDNLMEMIGYLGIGEQWKLRMAASLMELVLLRLKRFAGNPPIDKRVAKVIQHVLQNIDCNMTTEELAIFANISPSHLYALFRQYTGESPLQWRNAVRMNKACELLRNTPLRIAEIASRTGFHDQLYFSRSFRAAFGQSPSEFRMSGKAS